MQDVPPMKLTNVSKTAMLTLRGRAIESQKKNPILKDPMAERLLGRLESISSPEEKALLFGGEASPRALKPYCPPGQEIRFHSR